MLGLGDANGHRPGTTAMRVIADADDAHPDGARHRREVITLRRATTSASAALDALQAEGADGVRLEVTHRLVEIVGDFEQIEIGRG